MLSRWLLAVVFFKTLIICIQDQCNLGFLTDFVVFLLHALSTGHNRDSIKINHLRTLRNTKPCVLHACMWPKASDGKVYIPYVIANDYCKYLHILPCTLLQGYVVFYVLYSFFVHINSLQSYKVHIKGSYSVLAPELAETPYQ